MTETQRLVTSMLKLYDYGVTLKARDGVLDTMDRLITNAGAHNQTAEWQPDNVRYEESLRGERNMFVYIMHTLRTEPGWVDVEMYDSKQDQADKALDIAVIGRREYLIEKEQCKTGHLGKSDDLYVHKAWLKGCPDNLIAVCIERGVIYGGPLGVWKQVYKGSYAIDDDSKWMYVSEFKASGGWVVDIHEDIKKLISLDETLA